MVGEGVAFIIRLKKSCPLICVCQLSLTTGQTALGLMWLNAVHAQDLPSTMHVSGWYALRVPVMSKSYTLERGIVIELVLEVSL